MNSSFHKLGLVALLAVAPNFNFENNGAQNLNKEPLIKQGIKETRFEDTIIEGVSRFIIRENKEKKDIEILHENGKQYISINDEKVFEDKSERYEDFIERIKNPYSIKIGASEAGLSAVLFLPESETCKQLNKEDQAMLFAIEACVVKKIKNDAFQPSTRETKNSEEKKEIIYYQNSINGWLETNWTIYVKDKPKVSLLKTLVKKDVEITASWPYELYISAGTKYEKAIKRFASHIRLKHIPTNNSLEYILCDINQDERLDVILNPPAIIKGLD